MKQLLKVVQALLVQNDYEVTREDNVLSAMVTGQHGLWHFKAGAMERHRYVVCWSWLPFSIPKGTYNKAALLVAQLNENVFFGNFDLNLHDGAVTYKTSLRLLKDELSETLAGELVFGNLTTFDWGLPAFIGLVHGGRSVRQALSLVEKKRCGPRRARHQPSDHAVKSSPNAALSDNQEVGRGE